MSSNLEDSYTSKEMIIFGKDSVDYFSILGTTFKLLIFPSSQDLPSLYHFEIYIKWWHFFGGFGPPLLGWPPTPFSVEEG